MHEIIDDIYKLKLIQNSVDMYSRNNKVINSRCY